MVVELCASNLVLIAMKTACWCLHQWQVHYCIVRVLFGITYCKI